MDNGAAAQYLFTRLAMAACAFNMLCSHARPGWGGQGLAVSIQCWDYLFKRSICEFMALSVVQALCMWLLVKPCLRQSQLAAFLLTVLVALLFSCGLHRLSLSQRCLERVSETEGSCTAHVLPLAKGLGKLHAQLYVYRLSEC